MSFLHHWHLWQQIASWVMGIYLAALVVGTPLFCLLRWAGRLIDHSASGIARFLEGVSVVAVACVIYPMVPFIYAGILLAAPFEWISRTMARWERDWWMEKHHMRWSEFDYSNILHPDNDPSPKEDARRAA